MFEIIGYISFVLFIMFFVVFQFSMMFTGSYRKDLNPIEKIIGWVPLLPFIIMFLLTLYYLIEIFFQKLHKWFELNWGWVFVNRRKRDAWSKYLRKKYNK